MNLKTTLPQPIHYYKIKAEVEWGKMPANALQMLDGPPIILSDEFHAYVEESKFEAFFEALPEGIRQHVSLVEGMIASEARQWLPSDWLERVLWYLPNHDEIVEIIQDVITSDEEAVRNEV